MTQTAFSEFLAGRSQAEIPSDGEWEGAIEFRDCENYRLNARLERNVMYLTLVNEKFLRHDEVTTIVEPDGRIHAKSGMMEAWFSAPMRLDGRFIPPRFEGTAELQTDFGRCTGHWWLSRKS